MAAEGHRDCGLDDQDEEQKRVCLLRDIVVKQDPSCKDIDDSTLRRFLVARDLDVEKAANMFMKYIIWRKTFVPKGCISVSEVSNQMAQNKMFMQGKDKQGHPIAVLFGARHSACKAGGMDEFRRYLVFVLDKLCSSMPDGQEKFTIIGDLQGYGYCNSDIRGNLAAISILQRLAKVFIIHAPYIFTTMWKIIYPFIDKKTRNKIMFVDNKKLQETLLDVIDEDQLPEIYGGKLQLVPIHNC